MRVMKAVESLVAREINPHKFYDIAALEIDNGPEVSGSESLATANLSRPTPSEPLGVRIRKLASAVKGNRV